MTNGIATTVWKGETDESALRANAIEACNMYGDAHSTAAIKMVFTSCTPSLPLPDASAGGATQGIGVDGTYHNEYSDGSVGPNTYWGGGLLQGGCPDALNASGASIGTDAQCYCQVPKQWYPKLNACILVVDKWHNEECLDCVRGNPIAPLVGAKLQREDLGMQIGKERLVAVYDSRANVPYDVAPSIVNGVAGMTGVPAPALGGIWTTSIHKSLYIHRASTTANTGFTVDVFRGDGTFISFTHPTATTYVPVNPAVRDQLVPVLDGSGNQTTQVRLIDRAGNIELYDMGSLTTGTKANLLSVSYIGGGSLTYSYNGSNQLVKVTDHQGKAIRLRYESTGTNFKTRIREIEGTDARVISFAYNTGNQLSQITWPDGKVRQYLYERSDLPSALTGVVDENNSRLSTYTYDAEGRANSTELTGGVDRYAVSYGSPPSLTVTESLSGNVLTRDHWWVAPRDVLLELPNGTSSMLSVLDFNGMPLLTGETRPSGSGNSASSDAKNFDASANMLSRDDFQGQRTCYAYDSANRETVRVEGLASTTACSTVTGSSATMPAGARKITTTWHPDWKLPIQVTQPLRKTTAVYHGQPDPFNNNANASCTTAAAMPNGKALPVVCKQVEQGTLDTGVPGNPGEPDVYASNVSLLLNGGGTNGSTAVVDSGPAHRTMTAVGNAQISTAQSKFGGSALAFDGNGDYLTTPYSADFDFPGDFTIESYFRLSAYSASNAGAYGAAIVSRYQAVGGNAGWQLRINGTASSYTTINLYTGVTDLNVSGLTINLNTWYHVAVSRSGSTLRFFLNGTQVGSFTNSNSLTRASASPLYVGALNDATYHFYMPGYIDDLRLTKGVARYTANFTPPAQELFLTAPIVATSTTRYTYDTAGRVLSSVDPNSKTTTYAYYSSTALSGGTFDAQVDNVSLLLRGNGTSGSNVFTDSSANELTPTLVGAPSISTSQSKYGSASMSFGGTADALSYAHSSNMNLASGDFTTEAWVYLNSLATNRTILQKDQSYGTTYPSYLMRVSSTGALECFVGTGSGASYAQWVSSASGLISTGSWYHVAFTRQGTTLRSFINGSLVQTATQTGTPTDGGKPLIIGRYPGGGGAADGWMSGYIDDLRITKGVARYTTSFTAPSQELPNTGPTMASTGHTLGDPQSITNAAGQVTQFNLYDPAGRVRQMTDAKGIVTDVTYTPRGQVSTVSVTPPSATARLTTYTYDFAGQLTGVALPDGTSVGFSYDAAHRLSGATDTRGNAITYTLDSVGNRTAEEVRDPGGSLQRSISRSFDALNRLQQVTGAAQ